VPANSFDVDLANRLGFSLVHHTMGGFTGFGCGVVREQIVAIPFDLITQISNRKITRKDHEWQSLLASTGQPNFLNPDNLQFALKVEKEQYILRKSIV